VAKHHTYSADANTVFASAAKAVVVCEDIITEQSPEQGIIQFETVPDQYASACQMTIRIKAIEANRTEVEISVQKPSDIVFIAGATIREIFREIDWQLKVVKGTAKPVLHRWGLFSFINGLAMLLASVWAPVVSRDYVLPIFYTAWLLWAASPYRGAIKEIKASPDRFRGEELILIGLGMAIVAWAVAVGLWLHFQFGQKY
jgi:hypothetical protein